MYMSINLLYILDVAGESCNISDKRSFWSSPVANNQGIVQYLHITRMVIIQSCNCAYFVAYCIKEENTVIAICANQLQKEILCLTAR